MLRPGLRALPVALFLAACSDPAVEAPPPEILCAAEALYQARQAPLREAEDALRSRVTVFTGKLPIPKRQRLSRMVDQLSDGRGAEPLIAQAACERLLTPADRRALATSAANVAAAHQDFSGNSH